MSSTGAVQGLEHTIAGIGLGRSILPVPSIAMRNQLSVATGKQSICPGRSCRSAGVLRNRSRVLHTFALS